MSDEKLIKIYNMESIKRWRKKKDCSDVIQVAMGAQVMKMKKEKTDENRKRESGNGRSDEN